MAIIIPSKNIYEINNPKVRDNIIDNVSVEENIVTPNNEYEVSVYNEDIMDFSTEQTSSDPNGKDIGVNAYSKGYSIMGAGTLYYGVGAYCAFNNYKKTNNFSIKIPKLKNNHFINKLYYGKDEEGNSNIKYTISGYVNMGTASSTFTYNLSLSELVLNPSTITYGSPESGDDIKIEIPKKETYSYSGTYGNDTISATANATFYNSGTILTAKPSDLIENGIEYYILTFNVIAGWRVVKMGGYKGGLILAGSGDFPMSGTYEEYIPTNIEITIYGNTIGIDLNNGSVSYIKDENGNIVQGKGNKPHSLSGNELLQDSGKVGDIALTKHLAKNVLEQYKKGKETATLLCSIGEYYDILYPKIIENLSYNGKNFIQTNKLTIKNTITNPQEQGYSATFNFDFENIEMIGNETSIIIETPIDPDIAKSVLYFNLPDYVTLESNPVVVTKSKTFITIKTQNKQQMIDFAREHYGTLVTDYCYKVEQYRYTEAPISVYKLNVLDSSFNIITELYNEIFSEPKDFTFSFDKIENYKYLELVFTTTVSEDKCIIVYDVGNLPNGKHDLEVKVFNTTNGNFEVFIKEIKYVAISTKDLSLPMVFRLHDEVIPMVYSANGVDVPMSRHQYGLPKVFEVTGSNMIYDGAVWQELTLLELF